MATYFETLNIKIGNVTEKRFHELLSNAEGPLGFLTQATWEADDFWDEGFGWMLEMSSDDGLSDSLAPTETPVLLQEFAKGIFTQEPEVGLNISYQANFSGDESGFGMLCYTTAPKNLAGFFVSGESFSLTCDACGAELNLGDGYGDGTIECDECGEETCIVDTILAAGGTFEQFNYTLSDSGMLTEAAWDEDNEDEEDWDDED